jgi:subfamily B ATP-binding cassette protein HlyB/CyaB
MSATATTDVPSGTSGRTSPALPSGLLALVAVAQFHQRPCNPAELAQRVGVYGDSITPAQLILAAREIGLKARMGELLWHDLPRQNFPLMAELRDGGYLILARIEHDRLMVLDPQRGQLVLDQATYSAAATGRVLFVKPRLKLAEEPRQFGLRWFLPVLLKYRKPIVEALMAAFVVQVFALAMPIFIQLIIDKVLVYRSVPTLNVLGVGMLMVIGFEAILNILKTLLITHTSNRIDVTLGARLFAHLLRLPLRYFELRTVGSTVARVRELETIRQFLTGPTLVALIDMAFVGLFLLVMLFYSVPLTLVVLASLPFMVGLSLVVFPLLRRLLQRKFDRGAESQAFLVEAVTGMQTVKAMALEGRMYQRWEQNLANYVKSSYEVDRIAGIAGSVSQTIQRLGTLALLWVGVHLALKGSISVGELIAFQMISGQVTGPILRLAQLWQNFQQVGVSVERIGDVMNTAAEPMSGSVQAGQQPLKGHLAFDAVSFRYGIDSPDVLHQISFDIPAGSFVGLVGRSGSGKSTIAKLLQRLYLPTAGSIQVDGQDFRQVDPAWYRRQIGVVLQENVLFSGSVRENIAIAWPDASQERIEDAARLAGAHDFILELPAGYDSPVGERGEGLSGGQRQRVAIARAILGNPSVLVFDEATSALDFESERIIHANLDRLRAGRTMLFSAHRLSTIRSADLILVVDQGRIAESGTHESLLALGGIYAGLWQGEGA